MEARLAFWKPRDLATLPRKKFLRAQWKFTFQGRKIDKFGREEKMLDNKRIFVHEKVKAMKILAITIFWIY